MEGPKPNGVFIDAITHRHISTTTQELLDRRQLVWNKNYGWAYDVCVTDPARYALAGANGRFSLPALAQGVSSALQSASAGLHVAIQERLQQVKRMQQQDAKPDAKQ